MSMNFKSYEEAREKVDALRELGISKIRLSSRREDQKELNTYPWGWVVGAEPGGFIRSGLNISFSFEAKDPDFYLTYNCKGSYYKQLRSPTYGPAWEEEVRERVGRGKASRISKPNGYSPWTIERKFLSITGETTGVILLS